MHRLAYRNFGDHESLVVNHSVGSPSGIRWYEIRNPGATNPTLYQQGTFAPADGRHRWMGSIAMDGIGDIAVGYSVSSSSMNPGIYYTGRVPDPTVDPLGTLESENSIFAGTGSQTGDASAYRWGDYTSMTVDPVFDCKFWYTNEYLQSTGEYNWHTRIASFSFPSCVGCVGDCNRNHVVTTDEILTMINIELGSTPIIACLRGDRNGDGVVTVDEVTEAVNNSLNGCPTGGTAPVGGAAPLDGPIAGKTITQEIGSASGARGATLTIPVAIASSGGVVSATQLDLLYPTAVLSDPRCAKSPRLTDHSLFTSSPSDPPAPTGVTRLRTLVVNLDAASAFDDGRLFRCTFTINPTASPGTYMITGDGQIVSDEAGDQLMSTVSNGSVTVH